MDMVKHIVNTQMIVSVMIEVDTVCYGKICMGLSGNSQIIISFESEEQAEAFAKWIAEAIRNKEVIIVNENGGIPNDDIVRNSV